MGGGGEGRGERSPKIFFSALRASVWSRNKRDPREPAGLDPPLHLQQLKEMQSSKLSVLKSVPSCQ